MASLSNGYAIAYETRGKKSIPGPVESNTVLLRLATAITFIQKKLCCSGAMTRSWAVQSRYVFRHNFASNIA